MHIHECHLSGKSSANPDADGILIDGPVLNGLRPQVRNTPMESTVGLPPQPGEMPKVNSGRTPLVGHWRRCVRSELANAIWGAQDL